MPYRMVVPPGFTRYIGALKSFYNHFTVGSNSYGDMISYTVPSGKTLYVTYFGGGCLNEPGAMYVLLIVDGSPVVGSGGNPAVTVSLPTPVVVEGGSTTKVRVGNPTANTPDMFGSLGGYEL